jgi:hypothetical protein
MTYELEINEKYKFILFSFSIPGLNDVGESPPEPLE